MNKESAVLFGKMSHEMIILICDMFACRVVLVILYII